MQLIPFGTYLPCCKAPPDSTTAVLKSATWQNKIVFFHYLLFIIQSLPL